MISSMRTTIFTLSDNIRSAAMSSQAAASRIPFPVKADTLVPARARRHVNIGTVAAKIPTTARRSHTVKFDTAAAKIPSAARRSPTVNVADLASSLSVMAISKAPARKDIVSARIRERRERVIAKLGLPKIPRSLPPTRIPRYNRIHRPALNKPSPSMLPRRYGFIWIRDMKEPWRQGDRVYEPTHITEFVQISDDILYRESRIPDRATGRKPFAILGPRPIPAHFSPVFLPILPQLLEPVEDDHKQPKRKRGLDAYCHGRPHGDFDNGSHGYHSLRKGRRCECHGAPEENWDIPPHLWATTPAEADVDPHRKRQVRFTSGTRQVRMVEKWWPWGKFEPSTDPAMKEDDDAEDEFF